MVINMTTKETKDTIIFSILANFHVIMCVLIAKFYVFISANEISFNTALLLIAIYHISYELARIKESLE